MLLKKRSLIRFIQITCMVLVSSASIAVEEPQLEDGQIIVNACLTGFNPELVNQFFDEKIKMTSLNFCNDGDIEPKEGQIFVFGYGHAKFGEGDPDLCIGHECILGDSITTSLYRYQPNSILNNSFADYFFSKKIAGYENAEVKIFEVYPRPRSKHVGGYYIDVNKNQLKDQKIACFIWISHSDEEKLRLLNECYSRWLERKSPKIWADFDSDLYKRKIR